MCLLVLAWQAHPRYQLIVAANRDEFHERPAAPMQAWPAANDILAGRDLRAGGTWLGLDRRRRFGVVTNFRDLQAPRPDAPSRGGLVPAYLGAPAGAADFLSALRGSAALYSGFNLLLADETSLWYASNRADRFMRMLAPGVYGLSNEYLDTPWPKLRRVRQRFETWLGGARAATATDELLDLLNDRSVAPVDTDLPQTGLSAEWERVLSAPFVLHPEYGTRCSTVLLLEPSGSGFLTERRFDRNGEPTGETRLQLTAGQWP
jgi:uncharacterized protein with NRDE domain